MDDTDNDMDFSDPNENYLKDSQSAGLPWLGLPTLAIVKYYNTM